jgi:hypothetical protein
MDELERRKGEAAPPTAHEQAAGQREGELKNDQPAPESPAPSTAEDETTVDTTEGESVPGAIAGAIVSGISAVADRIARVVSPPVLANLYEVHPEARQGSPREHGLRFVPVEDIKGTAVAGIAQRGEDFLPLRPFRGDNWYGRWERIRDANRRLRPLPPVDLVKWQGDYWVVDGHNRVAAVLADKGVGLDAMVTELVPLDGRSSERPTSLLPMIGELAELRAAVAGHQPAMGVRRNDPSTWTSPESVEGCQSAGGSTETDGEVA